MCVIEQQGWEIKLAVVLCACTIKPISNMTQNENIEHWQKNSEITTNES